MDKHRAQRIDKPKTPHTKSRTGCKPCKNRKLKCDERRPSCKRCMDRDISCTYSPPSVQKYHHSRPSELCEIPSMAFEVESLPLTEINSHRVTAKQYRDRIGEVAGHVRPIQAPSTSTIDAGTSLELSGLELMLHYMSHTRDQLAATCGDEHKVYAWRRTLPDLATKSALLAHAIMAMSSLCLCQDIIRQPVSLVAGELDSGSYQLRTSVEVSKKATRYFSLAEEHHDRALALMKQELSSESGANGDTLCATSCLFAYFGPAYLSTYLLLQTRQPPRQRHSALNLTGNFLSSEHIGAGNNKPSIVNWFALLRSGPLNDSGTTLAEGLSPPIQALREHNNIVRISAEKLAALDKGKLASDSGIGSLPDAYKHSLYSSVCKTRIAAFTKLEDVIQSELGSRPPELHACKQALAILQQITTPFCSVFISSMRDNSHRNDDDLSNGGGDDGKDSPKPDTAPNRMIIYDKCPSHSISTWISRFSTSYLKLLQSHHPIALTVLAHWLVFLIMLEETWWFHGLGRTELNRIIARFEMSNNDVVDLFGADSRETTRRDRATTNWRDWLDWPISMIRYTNVSSHTTGKLPIRDRNTSSK